MQSGGIAISATSRPQPALINRSKEVYLPKRIVTQSPKLRGAAPLRTAPSMAHVDSARAGATYWPTAAPIVVQPSSGQHQSTLIMLHGRGDSGAGWAGIARMLAPLLPHTQFVFPTAAVRPITKLGGTRMAAWFDNPPPQPADSTEPVVPPGILDSQRYVEELLQQQEAAGVPSSRVVVGGFSQGAAMSLLMLRGERQLAGVMALSGYLPMQHEEVVSVANAKTPVLVCHGTADQMIAYSQAQQAADKLQQAGANFQFKTYTGMGHTACDEEMEDVKQFLVSVLG